jgi:hypothetical protein
MGLINDILGLGKSVGQIAEVFVPNKTKTQTQAHLRAIGAQAQFAAEFQNQRSGFFDRLVDALNRLPRPVMALGTVGLFSYAMIDPIGFTTRMQGLDYVPDPLWWLLGAVVSFYFGAREMHHFRQRKTVPVLGGEPIQMGFLNTDKQIDGNAALDDWRRIQTGGD